MKFTDIPEEMLSQVANQNGFKTVKNGSIKRQKYSALVGQLAFFFWISKGKYILKKNTAPYIGNVLERQKHQETKLQ